MNASDKKKLMPATRTLRARFRVRGHVLASVALAGLSLLINAALCRAEDPRAENTAEHRSRSVTQADYEKQAGETPGVGRVLVSEQNPKQQPKIEVPAPKTPTAAPAPALPPPGSKDKGKGTAPQSSEPRLPVAILERPVPAGSQFNTNYALWRCSGTRCETTTLDLRNFYEACTPLAQAAGNVVSFRSIELVLNASEIARCNSPLVQEFYVYACSGRDDLRSGSALSMNWEVAGRRFVSTEPGPTLFQDIPRNQCAPTRLYRVSIGPFHVSDLIALHFTFRSGRSGPYDTTDNWDMRKLIVQANTRRPGGALLTVPLIDLEDNPIHRFENVARWRVPVTH